MLCVRLSVSNPKKCQKISNYKNKIMSEETTHSYKYNQLSDDHKNMVDKIISDLKQLSVAEVREIVMAVRSEIEVRGSLSHLPDYQGR